PRSGRRSRNARVNAANNPITRKVTLSERENETIVAATATPQPMPIAGDSDDSGRISEKYSHRPSAVNTIITTVKSHGGAQQTRAISKGIPTAAVRSRARNTMEITALRVSVRLRFVVRPCGRSDVYGSGSWQVRAGTRRG